MSTHRELIRELLDQIDEAIGRILVYTAPVQNATDFQVQPQIILDACREDMPVLQAAIRQLKANL